MKYKNIWYTPKFKKNWRKLAINHFIRKGCFKRYFELYKGKKVGYIVTDGLSVWLGKWLSKGKIDSQRE